MASYSLSDSALGEVSDVGFGGIFYITYGVFIVTCGYIVF